MLTRGRLRSWVVTGALIAGAVTPMIAAAPAACAAESGPHAALVVDTGAGLYSYCVALDDDEVSGTELIVLAGEQHGLSYRFGFGGQAVCMLAGVGTEGDDCFAEYPEFWGYWRGSESGGWTWSGGGPSSTTVEDGDVDGWSWSSGDDGTSHRKPPATTFESVCGASTEAPSDDRGGDGKARERERSAPERPQGRRARETDAGGPDETTPARDDDGRDKRAGRTRSRARARAGRDRSVASVAPVAPSTISPASPRELDGDAASASRPSLAGLAGIGIALALGVAGAAIARRRRARV